MNTVEQIRKWCQGTFLACSNELTPIGQLVFDSRGASFPADAMFIALKTSVRDGHLFITDAYQKGIRAFLVCEQVDKAQLPGATIILVKDTLLALQQIGASHRKQFTLPVIGITGSNGKTIVKEWLYQLLGEHFNVVRSPKSYNSQTGVPLSVWQINDEHTLGIFEAGISQTGEMDRLEKIIKPDIGIITNIGEAHSDGFINMRQKVNEKLVLFSHAKHLVYCRDHMEVNECVLNFRQNLGINSTPLQLFAWSLRGEADLRITAIEYKKDHTTINGLYKGAETEITIPFTDTASVENAIHCWCVTLLLEVPTEQIARGFSALQPVSMRLELKHGANDCTLINDTYNSDLTSLQVALNYLEQQKQHTAHTVIMSDMLQMGKSDADLYEAVAELVGKRKIQRFIGIGPALFRNKSAFNRYDHISCLFYKDTAEFLSVFHTLSFSHEAILIKGARIFAFEKIAKLLEQQIHQTVLTIDLGLLRDNLNVFRSLLPPKVKTMAMVKAFAYGSGSFEIASILAQAGVDYLTVAYTEEGITLRKNGITLPIMVMSPDAASFDRMIAWKLEPEIYSFRSLQTFNEVAASLSVTDYPVHIKLDTGMHRLGFAESDISELSAALTATSHLKVVTIFSHLAASDDPNEDVFTLQQAKAFTRMSDSIIKHLGYSVIRHLCNSAAIVRHPKLHFDMVRLGLGLYGIDTSGQTGDKLHQISTLKTTIAQVRYIQKGENIGYGHHTIAEAPMRLATISIGYADGYIRSITKGDPYVLIHGKPAPIKGSICMDMCMVDITNIPEAEEGDEVIVFSNELPVTRLAEWAGTISYEIMTGISQRVKRTYINE